jgi:hypothetical protein
MASETSSEQSPPPQQAPTGTPNAYSEFTESLVINRTRAQILEAVSQSLMPTAHNVNIIAECSRIIQDRVDGAVGAAPTRFLDLTDEDNHTFAAIRALHSNLGLPEPDANIMSGDSKPTYASWVLDLLAASDAQHRNPNTATRFTEAETVYFEEDVQFLEDKEIEQLRDQFTELFNTQPSGPDFSDFNVETSAPRKKSLLPEWLKDSFAAFIARMTPAKSSSKNNDHTPIKTPKNNTYSLPPQQTPDVAAVEENTPSSALVHIDSPQKQRTSDWRQKAAYTVITATGLAAVYQLLKNPAAHNRVADAGRGLPNITPSPTPDVSHLAHSGISPELGAWLPNDTLSATQLHKLATGAQQAAQTLDAEEAQKVLGLGGRAIGNKAAALDASNIESVQYAKQWLGKFGFKDPTFTDLNNQQIVELAQKKMLAVADESTRYHGLAIQTLNQNGFEVTPQEYLNLLHKHFDTSLQQGIPKQITDTLGKSIPDELRHLNNVSGISHEHGTQLLASLDSDAPLRVFDKLPAEHAASLTDRVSEHLGHLGPLQMLAGASAAHASIKLFNNLRTGKGTVLENLTYGARMGSGLASLAGYANPWTGTLATSLAVAQTMDKLTSKEAVAKLDGWLDKAQQQRVELDVAAKPAPVRLAWNSTSTLALSTALSLSQGGLHLKQAAAAKLQDFQQTARNSMGSWAGGMKSHLQQALQSPVRQSEPAEADTQALLAMTAYQQRGMAIA